MNIFPMHAADFYKFGHIFQYPQGTQIVYANFTPRSMTHAKVLSDFDGKVVNFGLQGVLQWFLLDLWNRNFFALNREHAVERYTRRVQNSLGGVVNADHVGALHDLGYLPVEIKALPEGSRVNLRVPLFTIVNTHPDFYWVTNFLETALSAELWKSVTNATIAFEYRRLLGHFAKLTGSPLEFVPWQGHDFSMRGMSGIHDAAQSGAAHLLSFTGTDTVLAIDYLEDFYKASNEFVGGSVPATEHSVMCMGGSGGDELETFRRLIAEVYPTGVISIVSDTWDFWKVITEYARELAPLIKARAPDGHGNAKVVFRPDSGDPVKILTGYVLGTHPERGDGEVYKTTEGLYFRAEDWECNEFLDFWIKEGAKPLSESEVKGAVECLWDIFGGTITKNKYRLLDSHVGLIYGDSITLERAEAILQRLADKGFASGNVVFGIGSYTYQMSSRDTFGHAMKATWGVVNGEARELFKDPITDDGVKRSAKGLLRVEHDRGDFILHDQQTVEQETQGALRTVFKDGRLYNTESLGRIRERLSLHLL